LAQYFTKEIIILFARRFLADADLLSEKNAAEWLADKR
jgi:hypothetical protein